MRRRRASLAVAAAAATLLPACATVPQPVTKIVGGRVIVTRAVSPEAYEHTTRALMYEEEQRYDEAAAELQRALPFDDEAAELRAHLAELFVRLGRLDDAGDQIERSLRIGGTVDGYLASAHLRQARGQQAAALDALRDAVGLAITGDDPEAIERAHLELADAQVVGLDVTAGLATARQLVQSWPDTRRGRIQLAALAWSLTRMEEGAQALAEVLDQEPADVEARLLLAELRVAGNKVPEAKAAFTEAMSRAEAPLEIAAAYAGWLAQRGDVAEAQEIADRLTADAMDVDGLAQASALERAVKRPERALALVERAVKLGATPARAAMLAGQALAAKKDRAGAVTRFMAVGKDAPELVDARLAAAELLREDGKLDEADRLLEQTQSLTEDAVAQLSLTVARSLVDEKRGDAVRAARRLDEAIAKAPAETRLLLARAALDERRGEWKKAIETAEKVLARDPRSVDALNFAGFTAADHGADLPLATRRLQAAVALAPGTGGIIDSLGWAYFKAGDLARAATFLEQAGRLEPADPEITAHLGDLYAKRGERVAALDAYRRALTLTPPDRLVRDLTERIRTLEAKSAAGR